MSFYNYRSTPSPEFSAELSEGDSNVGIFPYPGWTSPDPPIVDVIRSGGQEAQGIYPVVEVDSSPTVALGDRYYDPATPAFVLALNGPEYTAGTTVTKTYQWVSWSLARIYESKLLDIGNKDRDVFFNAVDTSLDPDWWLIVTERARLEFSTLNDGGLNRKIESQGWPGGSNRPLVPVYNAATGRAKRQRIPDQTRWETLMLQELPLHDQNTGNATEASGDALDLAYNDGAGNRADIVAHDPDDPAWGYPPTIDVSDATRQLYGEET